MSTQDTHDYTHSIHIWDTKKNKKYIKYSSDFIIINRPLIFNIFLIFSHSEEKGLSCVRCVPISIHRLIISVNVKEVFSNGN